MGTPGPQKINRYGIAFKLKAVQMSNQPGVLIKDVAESLCIHPFMLSRWRKEVRDGKLVGSSAPIDTASVPSCSACGRWSSSSSGCGWSMSC
jgi:transposase